MNGTTGKILLVAFNGEAMCFGHVLLNALDMAERGLEAAIIVEGAATGLLPSLLEGQAPFSEAFAACRDKGLLAGVCRACSAKMGSLAAVEAADLPLLGEMKGHPALGRWIAEGWTVVTF